MKTEKVYTRVRHKLTSLFIEADLVFPGYNRAEIGKELLPFYIVHRSIPFRKKKETKKKGKVNQLLFFTMTSHANCEVGTDHLEEIC